MNIHQNAAIVAALVTVVMICFQLLLAAGLPLGRAAWGGQHSVLPKKLRLASLASAGLLGLIAWLVLARADLVTPMAESMAVRVAMWVFAGFMCLNTLGNLVSKSRVERLVMTPTTLLLAVCFVIVALS